MVKVHFFSLLRCRHRRKVLPVTLKKNIRFVCCLIWLILQSILSQEILLKTLGTSSIPWVLLWSIPKVLQWCWSTVAVSADSDPGSTRPPHIWQKKRKNRKISLEREHETSYSRSQTCWVDQVWSIWFCPEVMPQGLKNLNILMVGSSKTASCIHKKY